MQVRSLGWAGIELQSHGERVVIDPLQDAGAVFAFLGERVASLPTPAVIPAEGGALAGMVTHLHRDHADAAALAAALAPGAPVYEPVGYGGAGLEQLGLIQADRELTKAGFSRRPLEAWSTVEVGPFALTALPAVDGTGDPQVSWLIDDGETRVLHLGDTMFHAWWWRFKERFGAPAVVCAPINGARVNFPHRMPPSPLPGAMDPGQAALAAELLGAEVLVPIHYDGGYDIPELYEPVPDALGVLQASCSRVSALGLGESIEV